MLLPCFRRGRVWAAPRLHYESSCRLLGIMSTRSRRLHDCTLRIIHAPNEVFPFRGHPLHPIFANQPYLARMPLGIFAVSSSGVPVTLSHITLVRRHPSKILVFDAKPLFSETVTLSLPKLFFVDHRLFPPRSQILNGTALNISLSVK